MCSSSFRSLPFHIVVIIIVTFFASFCLSLFSYLILIFLFHHGLVLKGLRLLFSPLTPFLFEIIYKVSNNFFFFLSSFLSHLLLCLSCQVDECRATIVAVVVVFFGGWLSIVGLSVKRLIGNVRSVLVCLSSSLPSSMKKCSHMGETVQILVKSD